VHQDVEELLDFCPELVLFHVSISSFLSCLGQLY